MTTQNPKVRSCIKPCTPQKLLEPFLNNGVTIADMEKCVQKVLSEELDDMQLQEFYNMIGWKLLKDHGKSDPKLLGLLYPRAFIETLIVLIDRRDPSTILDFIVFNDDDPIHVEFQRVFNIRFLGESNHFVDIVLQTRKNGQNAN